MSLTAASISRSAVTSFTRFRKRNACSASSSESRDPAVTSTSYRKITECFTLNAAC